MSLTTILPAIMIALAGIEIFLVVLSTKTYIRIKNLEEEIIKKRKKILERLDSLEQHREVDNTYYEERVKTLEKELRRRGLLP